jgi:predicted MFS family arabinose efflux permease
MDRSLIRPSPRVLRRSGQVREGLRYVWSEPPLRLPLALLAVIGTFAFAFPVTLPLLAERTLDGDANTFTLLFAVMSAGSVVGALALARQRDVSTRLLAWSAVGLGLSMVVLAVSPSVEVALAATVPVGIANVLLISGANSVVQLRAAPAMRGRVLALSTVVFLGTAPIGGPIVGWVSEQFGARSGIWLGAVTSVLAGVFVLLDLRRIADREVLADRG